MDRKTTDENSFFAGGFSDECKSLIQCVSLKRITSILHFYYFINNNNGDNGDEIKKQLIEYIISNNYYYIDKDYKHIINSHLNETNAANTDILNNSMKKYISCNKENCKSYNKIKQLNEKNIFNKEYDENTSNINYMDMIAYIHNHFIHFNQSKDRGFLYIILLFNK